MLHNSITNDIHVFKSRGHRIAFNGANYAISVMDENSYEVLKKAVTGEQVSRDEEEVCKTLMTNLLWGEKISAPGQPAVPLRSLCLLVAMGCNLTCDYCFNSQGAYEFHARQSMREETARNAIDFLLANCENRCGVSFFGGEPLTQFPLIVKTVEYAESEARNKGIDISFQITTNGTLLSPKVIKFLDAHKFSVIISLDGDESTHNYYRQFTNGAGSYQVALNGAKSLITAFDSQQRVTIRGTYTRQQSRFSRSYAHLIELGFENISIEPATGAEAEEYAVQLDDLPAISKEYEHLAEIYQQVRSVSSKVSFFHFDKHLKDLTQRKTSNRPCGAANGFMAVSPDGRLYPCHRIMKDEFCLGNVNEIAHEKSELNQEIRSGFRKAVITNRPICQSCWARNLCGGNCYADNIDKKLGLDEPHEVYCNLLKTRAELAIGVLTEQTLMGRTINFPAIEDDFGYAAGCPSRCECQCQVKGDD